MQVVDAVRASPAALTEVSLMLLPANLRAPGAQLLTRLQAEEVVRNNEKKWGLTGGPNKGSTLARNCRTGGIGVNTKYLYLEEENFTLDGSTGKIMDRDLL